MNSTASAPELGPATLDLATRWRADAEVLRRRAATLQADLLLSCAAELEAAMQEHALAELTLAEAERESGYTIRALQEQLSTGKLDNVGTKGRPRVLRGQLPRKAGHGVNRPDGGPDLAGTVLRRRLG